MFWDSYRRFRWARSQLRVRRLGPLSQRSRVERRCAHFCGIQNLAIGWLATRSPQSQLLIGRRRCRPILGAAAAMEIEQWSWSKGPAARGAAAMEIEQ